MFGAIWIVRRKPVAKENLDLMGQTEHHVARKGRPFRMCRLQNRLHFMIRNSRNNGRHQHTDRDTCPR